MDNETGLKIVEHLSYICSKLSFIGFWIFVAAIAQCCSACSS